MLAQGQVNGHNVVLSNGNFTCPKELIIMHKELSSYVDTMHKLFKNSMKPDINSIENSEDSDQLASKEAN